jgi:hypothetical protein
MPLGSPLFGGGSYVTRVNREVIEQKWINSEGDVEWRPLETVFLEDRCTSIAGEEFDFMKSLEEL